MFKRLHTVYERMYESFMLLLTRHAPKQKIRKREHELSREMPWYSGDAYHCDPCPWVLMRWDAEALGWHCGWCGQHYHPRVAVTEKRAVVLPQAHAAQPEPPKPVFVTGQLSFLHSRHMLANSTELLPNGLPRLAWKNGQRIDSGQLKPLTPAEQKLLMDIFQEDRKRTG